MYVQKGTWQQNRKTNSNKNILSVTLSKQSANLLPTVRPGSRVASMAALGY